MYETLNGNDLKQMRIPNLNHDSMVKADKVLSQPEIQGKDLADDEINDRNE